MVVAMVAATAATTLASGMMSSAGNEAAGATMSAAGNNALGMANNLSDWVKGQMFPYQNDIKSDADNVIGQYPLSYMMQLMGMGPNGNTVNPDGSQNDPMNSYLLKPFNPSMTDVENTPGYQFRMQQGLKAVTNSNAAKGLATSGNALRGAADYSTGLAQSTWQQDYQNDLTNRMTVLGMLSGLQDRRQNLLGMGQQGVLGEGSVLSQILGTGTGAFMQGQSGQAAGQVGAGNAWANAIQGGGSQASNYMLLNSIMNKQNGQTPAGPTTNPGMYGAPANSSWQVGPDGSIVPMAPAAPAVSGSGQTAFD